MGKLRSCLVDVLIAMRSTRMISERYPAVRSAESPQRNCPKKRQRRFRDTGSRKQPRWQELFIDVARAKEFVRMKVREKDERGFSQTH